jgi:PAS domain S-box-containing protein
MPQAIDFSGWRKTPCRNFILPMLLLLICFSAPGFAQRKNIRTYDAGEGMTQSQVQVILQDNSGYLWFGTASGVFKFDGVTFTNFNKVHGLAENFIESGLKDREGNLWFGHINGTVARYNPQTKNFESITLVPGGKGSKTVYVEKIYQDHTGAIWFATLGWGVFRLSDQKLSHFNVDQGLLSNEVFDIMEDDKQQLWFATKQGISIYSIDSMRFLPMKTDLPFSKKIIVALESDRYHRVWIGASDEGVMVLDSTGAIRTFTEKDGLASSMISSLYADRNGLIWIGTAGDGLSYAQIEKDLNHTVIFNKLTIKNGLSSNQILSFFEDHEGNVWVGTDGGGASQVRRNEIEAYDDAFGLHSESIWSIVIDHENTTWLGSDDGLIRLRKPAGPGKETQLDYFRMLGQEKLGFVARSLEDREGNLWFVSTEQGVIRWNRSFQRLEKVDLGKAFQPRQISDICEDKRGNLWITSFHNGLACYNPADKSVITYTKRESGLSSDSLNTVFKDSRGQLWFATNNGGIMRYKNDKFTTFSYATGHPINSAISITEDPKHNLWMVTSNDELYCFNGSRFINYTSRNNLGEGALYSVISDEQALWVGTNNGVARLRYGDSLFIQYSRMEGYPISEANENAVYRDKNGFLWFGTIHGAVKVNSRKQFINKIPPLIDITKLRVFLKDATLPIDGKFEYNRNYLTFHFIGLSYSAPEQVCYRYFLDGFDKQWSPVTTENYATYSNLPPGHYSFKIIAANANGVWSKEPTSYSFEVLTPFWRTWWFYFFLTAALFVVLYTYIYQRILRVQRDKKLLEDKVQQRTAELWEEKINVEHANQALRESEAKFRVYAEMTSAAIFIYRGARFIYTNPITEAITGYTRAELLQMNFWDVVHPEHRDLVRQRGMQRQQGENVPDRYQFKILSKNGEARWLDFSARRIVDDGQPAALGTAFDVTSQKLAEEALMLEKERLAVTLRAIGDGVVTLDTEQKIMIFNSMAEKITAYRVEEAAGEDISAVFKIRDEKTGKPILDPVNEIIESGIASPDMYAILTALTGEERHIVYNITPLLDKESKLVGAVLVLRDITQQRKMEDELLKTQKLESVGILAGGIAHDFNNILTAILGNLSLIRMYSKPGEKIYERIESAEKATIRAQDLTQQLLTFSKGGAPIKQATDIQELVRDSVSFMLRGSKVRWQIDVKDNLKAVNADSGQISQVIQNLVLNAGQAMPAGGDIKISLRNFEHDGNQNLPLKAGSYIKIDIADTGIGIPQEYLLKIFDPFFTTKQTGSGLGLATSYSIIAKHQGHIDVVSSIGKGSCFSIYLPALENGITALPAEAIDHEPFKGNGKILLMDDEEMVLSTASEILKFFGYEVDLAHDGREALQKYTERLHTDNCYQLVIMDLTIPGGMGGQTAIKKLLQIDPQAKAIVASGYSSDPVMANYQKYGFIGCMRKPFRVDEVRRLLMSLDIRRSKN